jgi:hypothetical protein
MVEAVAQAGEARSATRPSIWLFVCVLFAVVATALFAYSGLRFANETQRELRLIPWLPYDLRVDWGYFYAGADMVRHGEAFDLYPNEGELTYYPGDPIFQEYESEYLKARLLARGNFYNPPILGYLLAPLTNLSFRDSFWLFSSLSLIALMGYVAMSWKVARQIPEWPFLIIGVLSFKPVHEVIIMGHMTLFFMAAITAGFLLLRAEKQVLAGLALSLLAIKPQWAVLPGLFLLVRGQWRALATMFVASSAIFFIPFLITGIDTFKDYVAFLRQASKWDIEGGPHMFSWNGFLFKLQGGWPYSLTPVPPERIYALIALTAIPLAVIWYGRDFALGVAATIISMLLISTHSVWYDWALLSVAALFLVLRSPQLPRTQRVEMWIVLVALHIAGTQSMAELLYPDRHVIDWFRPAFFSMTPVAFAALLWIASIVIREGQLKPPVLPASWRQRLSPVLRAGS